MPKKLLLTKYFLNLILIKIILNFSQLIIFGLSNFIHHSFKLIQIVLFLNFYYFLINSIKFNFLHQLYLILILFLFHFHLIIFIIIIDQLNTFTFIIIIINFNLIIINFKFIIMQIILLIVIIVILADFIINTLVLMINDNAIILSSLNSNYRAIPLQLNQLQLNFLLILNKKSGNLNFQKWNFHLKNARNLFEYFCSKVLKFQPFKFQLYDKPL